AAEFPGPRTSLGLALQVPFQIAHGRSGFLVHVLVALLYMPMFGVLAAGNSASLTPAGATAAVVGVVCLLLGGWHSRRAWLIALLAAASGVAMGFLPLMAHHLARNAAGAIGLTIGGGWFVAFAYALAIYAGTLIFGAYLMLLTILGLEQHQA